jgi:hypothetical protein
MSNLERGGQKYVHKGLYSQVLTLCTLVFFVTNPACAVGPSLGDDFAGFVYDD